MSCGADTCDLGHAQRMFFHENTLALARNEASQLLLQQQIVVTQNDVLLPIQFELLGPQAVLQSDAQLQ